MDTQRLTGQYIIEMYYIFIRDMSIYVLYIHSYMSTRFKGMDWGGNVE